MSKDSGKESESSAFEALLGSKLRSKDGELSTASLKAKVVGFYFSAHWCPPCRHFTPKLAQFYRDFKKTEKGKDFEIVFLSSDRNKKDHEEYYGSMPWLALPLGSPEKEKLSSKWKVQGIPTLILVDSSGQVLNSKAVGEVMRDPQGTGFPWIPKAFWEAIDGKLVDSKGNESQARDLKSNEVIGLYFGDHRTQKTTSSLAEAYQKLRGKGSKLEIIYVGGAGEESEESAWKSCLATMPWKAFGFQDPRLGVVNNLFDVDSLPTLILVDSSGKEISTSGVALVLEEAEDFPWKPKPLAALQASSLDVLNSVPCLILFPSEKERTAQVAQLEAVATEFFKKFADEKSKAKADEEEKLRFLYAGDHKLVSTVADFLGLKSDRPQLLIINIPEREKFVFTSELSEASIRQFVTGFLDKKLASTPLR